MNPITVKDRRYAEVKRADSLQSAAADEKAFARSAFISISILFLLAWVLTG